MTAKARNASTWAKAQERGLQGNWALVKPDRQPALVAEGWDFHHPQIKYCEDQRHCFEELIAVNVEGTKRQAKQYFTYIVVAVNVLTDKVLLYYSDGDVQPMNRDIFRDWMDRCTQNSCSVCHKKEDGDAAVPLYSCLVCNKPSHDTCLSPAVRLQLGDDRNGLYTCNDCMP
jgi:hypothetical protein